MNRFFTLIGVAAVCALTACSEEKGPKNDGPVKLDDPKDFKKEYRAEQLGSGISFTAEGSWTAAVTAATKAAGTDAWIDIEPKRGEAGANTLQVTLQPNQTGKDREASITISCLGSQTTFVVKQTATTSDGEVPGVYFRIDDNTEWTRELPDPYHSQKLVVKSVGGAVLTLDTLRLIAEMSGGPAILDLGEALYETRGFPLEYMGAPIDYPGGLGAWDEAQVHLTPESVVLPRNVSKLSSMAFSGAGLQSIDLSQIDSVGFAAFRYCDKLTEVRMNSTMHYIGECAFEQSGLLEVTLPESLRAVGAYAFMNSALQKLNVESASDTLCIGDMAFYNCEFLRTLNLGNREVHIQPQAFQKCIDLREADLRNVTMIGSMAFQECTLLSKVTLGAAQTIGSRAFAVCPALSDVVLGDGLKVIGEGAFSSCERLRSVDLPASIRRIEKLAFKGCDLRSVEFPENVDSLGSGIYLDNLNLSSVTFKTQKLRTIPDRFLNTNKLVGMIELPESVTRIGENAFAFCDNLSYISMGSGMKYIGARAFMDCPRLGSIICHAATPPVCGDDMVFSSSGQQSGQGVNQCRVPESAVDAYKADAVWNTLEKRQNFLILGISGE